MIVAFPSHTHLLSSGNGSCNTTTLLPVQQLQKDRCVYPKYSETLLLIEALIQKFKRVHMITYTVKISVS